MKKKAEKKKQNTAAKKHPGKNSKTEKSAKNRINRINRTKKSTSVSGIERLYPEITALQEIAVLAYSRGESIYDISKTVNRGKSTVWDWLQEKRVKEALEKEREKVYSEAKAKTPVIVDATYKALLIKAQHGLFKFSEGVQFLEKSGYLHTTQDKEEQNRKKAALVEQLLGELQDIVSDPDEEETD